jgi:hypothetical protein
MNPVDTSTVSSTTAAPVVQQTVTRTTETTALPAALGTTTVSSTQPGGFARATEVSDLKEAAFAGRKYYTKPYDVGCLADEDGDRRNEVVKNNKHQIRADIEMQAAKDPRFGPAERIQAGLDAMGDKVKGALHGIAGGRT